MTLRGIAVSIAVVVSIALIAWLTWHEPHLGQPKTENNRSQRAESAPDPYYPPATPDPGQRSLPESGSQFQTLVDPFQSEKLSKEVAYQYGNFVPITEYRWNCQDGIYYVSRQLYDMIETCERRFEIEHAYSTFTNEQLAQIAPTDGEAAFLLAHRQLIDVPEGEKRHIEAGLNNVMSAIIRGGGRQAFDLLFDPKVFSPYSDSHSYMVWSYVGLELGLLDDAKIERFSRAEAALEPDRLEQLQAEALKISELLKKQRLIVMGTEF